MKRAFTTVFTIASIFGSSVGAAQATSQEKENSQIIYQARVDPHICLVCEKFISNNEVWCYEEPCPD